MSSKSCKPLDHKFNLFWGRDKKSNNYKSSLRESYSSQTLSASEWNSEDLDFPKFSWRLIHHLAYKLWHKVTVSNHNYKESFQPGKFNFQHLSTSGTSPYPIKCQLLQEPIDTRFGSLQSTLRIEDYLIPLPCS